MDGPDEHRRHQLRQRQPHGPGPPQQVPQGHPPLHHRQPVLRHPLPPQLVGAPRPPGADGGGLLVVLLEAVRLLLEPGAAPGQLRRRAGEVLRVPLQQVAVHQRTQELQRPGAVGQRVVNLQADPAAVVEHPKQQAPPLPVVDGLAGRRLLRLNGRGQVAVLQIVPEGPPLHHRPVQGEALHGPLQGGLEGRRVHRLGELAGEAEHLRVAGRAVRGKDFRGVVQAAPAPGAGAVHGSHSSRKSLMSS